jgi:hypothetical protein
MRTDKSIMRAGRDVNGVQGCESQSPVIDFGATSKERRV